MKTKKILLLVVLATYLLSGVPFAHHERHGNQSTVAGEFGSYVFPLSWSTTFARLNLKSKKVFSSS